MHKQFRLQQPMPTPPVAHQAVAPRAIEQPVVIPSEEEVTPVLIDEETVPK